MTPEQEINHAKFRLKYHNLSEDDLMSLMSHQHRSVKIAALRNPNATVEMLHKGLEDTSSSVKEAVLKHPNATVEMLNKGLNDRDWEVKREALRQLKKRESK